MARRRDAEPAGPKKNFLVVLTPHGREYWDAAAYRPHLTGDGTLQVQKDGQAVLVTLYSPVGWLKYCWELAWPVEVDDLRVDGRLPF
jgi:hypothetical protein